MFIFINIQAAFAQNTEVLELVRNVRERAIKKYGNIEILAFSGRSVFFDYMGSKIVDMNTVRDYEDCYFNGYWEKPDSLQIIVKAFRTVDPDQPYRQYFWSDFPLPNPMQYSFFNSITPLEYTELTTLDPESGEKKKVRLKSMWPIFPFAEGADSLYNYEIISEVGMNNRRIIELRVGTKSEDTPGLSGIFHIDADEKDIVGSDYTFNEAADLMRKFLTAEGFPVFARIFIDFDASYRVYTKKVLVNGVYWLPEKIVEDVNIKSLSSRISFQRELEFTSYFINMKPDDTPLDLSKNGMQDKQNKEVIFRRDPLLESEVFSTMEDSAKLTKEEENRIISSVENKFLQMELNKEKMNFEQKGRKLVALAKNFGSNVFLYNRVEGVRFFYNMGFTSFLMNNSLLNIEGGYGTRDKRFKGELSYQKYLGKKRKFLLQGKIYDNIDYEESDNVIPTVMNTYTSLFAKLDHMDYYYTTGISLGLRYELNENLKFSLTAVSQKEQGAENNADFGLLNWNTPFRLNPDIQCGKFNGIRSSLTFNNYNTSININAEYTDRNTFKSDFEYGIVRSDLSYVYEPNYTSKFILTLSGGISSGDLPPQRWFDLGGKIFMQYYGNLRGVGYKAFTGDRMASGLLEYSFCYGDVWDSVQKRPWWEYAFRMTKFTLWTGQGWSELSDKNSGPAEGKAIPMMTTDGIYREFGFSIGDRFSLFRFDFITSNSSDSSLIFSINFWR